ncbi:MAG: efflux RND transporter periplasmic adaptor subunit, partial [Bacteroidetes bacterium]
MEWIKQIGSYILALVLALLVGYWWGKQESGEATPTTMSLVRCSPQQLGFTCSMHPEVRLVEAGNCPLCQMPLVKEVVLPGQATDRIRLSPEAAALANIQTQVISSQAGAHSPGLELLGKIAVDHQRVYTQVASLPGRIEALYAQRPGQYIKKGQPIARIYSKELIAAVEAFRRPNTPESVKLSARNNLRDWQVPDSTFQRLIQARDYHQAVDIYASASGLVQELNAHVGQQAVNTIMGAPTTLYTLVDLSKVWLELQVYESQVEELRTGQRFSFTVDAFPGQTYEAQLLSLSPGLDESSRTLKAIAAVHNPQLKLRPGMLARARLPSTELNEGEQLLVPKRAVLWTGKRSVVFVVDPE